MLDLKLIEQPKALLTLGRAKFTASILHYDQDPKVPECPERWHNSYRHYMHHDVSQDKLIAPAYVSHAMPFRLKRSVARLRLSCTKLRVVCQHTIPYEERVFIG